MDECWNLIAWTFFSIDSVLINLIVISFRNLLRIFSNHTWLVISYNPNFDYPSFWVFGQQWQWSKSVVKKLTIIAFTPMQPLPLNKYSHAVIQIHHMSNQEKLLPWKSCLTLRTCCAIKLNWCRSSFLYLYEMYHRIIHRRLKIQEIKGGMN